jgi:hypothetical protein
MSENRLDTKIKELLEQRTLTPSEGAWKAVEDRLDPPVATPRSGIAWYAIAAGFVGILWFTVLSTDENPDGEIPIENTVRTESQPVNIQVLTKAQQEMPRQDEIVLSSVPETADRPISGDSVLEDMPSEKEIRLANAESLVETMLPQDKLGLKVAEVVAQVALLEDLGVAVEDRVIDSLLRAAHKQVWEERMLSADQKIDAMALLSDVEGELNRSLRDQLFEKLKDSYLKVRDAVAYRNE